MSLQRIRMCVHACRAHIRFNFEVCHDAKQINLCRMLLRAALLTFRPLCLSRSRITRVALVRSMSEDVPAQQTRMQKTNAKEFYCLTEKDVSIGALCDLGSPVTLYPFICVRMQLEPLTFTEKANRRYKNATPTKLYTTQEVRPSLQWAVSDVTAPFY